MNLFFLLFLFLFSQACEDDSDCKTYHKCISGECKRKSLFPLGSNEILGTCLISVASGLANAGGIGGGPVMVIILITLFNFDAYESVPVSQLIIFGGSLTAILVKVFLRHPIKQRPLIDFDVALLLSSPLLIGTRIGVIVNLVIPQWLILMLLTVLLAYISVDSMRTAIRLYRKENSTKTSVRILDPDIGVVSSYGDIDPILERIYKIEQKIAPPKSVAAIVTTFLFVVLISFLRGSRSFSSIAGIAFCSAGYWVMTGFGFLVLLILTGYAGAMMLNRYVLKTDLGYDFDTMDLKWSRKMIAVVVLAGFIAGLAAGIVGVGGGLVMNPVMLRLGMRPEVSTASSSFMVLFTATISMLQYAIAGKLDFVYGLWTCAFSLIGSLIGVQVIKKMVDKYKRSSIIVMLLACILITCFVIIPTYGIYEYLYYPSEDGFKNYCR
jgi:uncharacterized membrane protein YfcA